VNNATENAINRIQQLQQAFRQNLLVRVNELFTILQSLDSKQRLTASTNQLALKNIHDLAHKLAGSAGTFQFNEVYNTSKALEHFCFPLLDPPSTEVENWSIKIEQLFLKLQDAANNNQTTPSPKLDNSQSSTIEKETFHPATQNKIILVDDDELISALIQEQTKHFGYHIDCISNPEELSDFLAKNEPEVILMDIVFPHYNFTGIDLIKELSASNKIHCPVIFLSNREDFNSRLEAVRAGGNGYIAKPVNILELIEILDRYAHKSNSENFRALIIDNDLVTAEHYAATLKNHNFTSKLLPDPLDAINLLVDFLPDIILLDIDTTKYNGLEIAEVIRQDHRFTHIPILFLSSDSEKKKQFETIAVGADRLLNKKASEDSFISNVLSHSRRSKELHNVINRLRNDQLRFQAVSHSTTDAIVTLNKEGLIILWNEGAEHIFGYSSLEVIGQSIELIIPEKYQAQHRKGFHNLVSRENVVTKKSIESKAITKNKKLISIELTYTEWISGSDHFFTSIIRDTSERKAIEKKLQSKQENLNAIITNSAEGIITIDSKGIIETLNPRALAIFGYSLKELQGQNISILMHKKMRKQHDYYLANSEIHSSKIINKARELQGLRKDGSSFPMELNVSPMEIDGLKKFVGTLHDITQRTKNIELLTTAKKEAELANQAKSQFLSSMSHELRTPLNAILGFTQILQEEIPASANVDQNDSLNYIFSSGHHLLNLINEVLDLSKIESGNVAINLTSLDLISNLKHIIEITKPEALSQKIELISNFNTDSSVFITADSSRLNQVFNNLLSNAIKYNKDSGKITISLSETETHTCIYIKDEGLGIPKDMLPNLFEPFNRLGAEQSEIEGTGIGLTITKMLVELMRGSIGASSEEGSGCTFWVKLEKIPIQTTENIKNVTQMKPNTEVTAENIGTSILYIEDNHANRLLMKKIISRQTDYAYYEATNGTDGIKLAIEIQPKIILLDINLPDMSGLEVFSKLKELETFSAKVIIVSANAMIEDIKKIQDLDIFAYITKPLDSQQLSKTLKLALET